MSGATVKYRNDRYYGDYMAVVVDVDGSEWRFRGDCPLSEREVLERFSEMKNIFEKVSG